AAWLAGVWDGERDDAGSDAEIQAEHMVSFLDDGAIDLAGTGTMRSLAATAADDAPEPAAAPPAAPPAAAEAAASPAPAAAKSIGARTAASGPRPALDPPVVRPDGAARQGRTSSTVSQISSSTSTVASGTFRTVPSGRLRKRGGLAPALSLVAVAIAAGAIVF